MGAGGSTTYDYTRKHMKELQTGRQTESGQPTRHRQAGRQAGTKRQRDRETERQRDRETERQRDRETERQRDRETGREPH